MSYDEHLISMAGGDGETVDQLAAIEARSRVAMDYPGAVTIEQSQADVPALLALVRDQQAKLDRAGAVADDLAERGDRIEEKFERNGNGSISSTRNAGRGIGYREAARNIRAALTATEETA